MKKKWGLLTLLVAIAGLFALASIRVGQMTRPVEVGQLAPDFTLPDLDGNMVSLRDYRGRVVIINFWATWCPPCRKEMPAFQQLHQEMGDRVVILAVDRAEPAKTVRKFFDKYGLTFTALLDQTDELTVRYQLTGIPESFFVDKNGIVRAKFIGAMTIDQMRKFVQIAEGSRSE